MLQAIVVSPCLELLDSVPGGEIKIVDRRNDCGERRSEKKSLHEPGGEGYWCDPGKSGKQDAPAQPHSNAWERAVENDAQKIGA